MTRIRGAQRNCLVCNHPTNSLRLGVDACRACALFYKRTTLQGKNYVCRQSNGKCEIRQKDPFLCKSCRYLKCVSIGMKLWETTHKIENEKIDKNCNIELSVRIVEPSSTMSTDEILSKMARAYKTSLERRQRSECSLRNSAVYEKNEVRSPSGEVLYLSTHDFCSDSLPYRIGELLQMTGIVFPEYAQLSQEEQMLMRKAFVGTFYLIEKSYLTCKYFPGGNRYLMMSPTTCYDMQHPSSYWLTSKDPVEAPKILEFYNRRSFAMNQPVINEAKLTDTEYHAALCLLIWDFTHAPWIPDNIYKSGERIRRRILEELHRYYRGALECFEYAPRLGRLLTLIHTTQETLSLLQLKYQEYKLLGVSHTTEDDLVVKVIL